MNGQLTAAIMDKIKELTAGPEAAAPNLVSEMIYEQLVETFGPDELEPDMDKWANRVADLCFELASELVKEPPTYM